MEIYNHFEYARRIARKLKDVEHSDKRPRFFEAHGIEDLYSFDEKLSSISGFVLIAVDGCESESVYNGADGLFDSRHYAYLVACNAITDKPASITLAMEKSRAICKQIRNALFADMNLTGYLSRNTAINGIGPIGDNFYGCMLSIDIDEPDDRGFNKDFWLK